MARNIRDEMAGLVVIYRMLECGDKISVVPDDEHAFIGPILEQMIHDDLIQVEGEFWTPTAKGIALRDRMAQVHDQLLQFEIFGAVSLNKQLSPQESPDGVHVFDHVYDPRFRDPQDPVERNDENVQDLRIAMVTFLRDEMAAELPDPDAFDPRRLVFLRMLADGAFRGDIWFDLRLGKPFDEVEEIVKTAYPWTAVSITCSIESAKDMMRAIYTDGMLERRKRAGDECAACGIPLALFEQDRKLDHCPNPDCGVSLATQRRPVVQCRPATEVVEEVFEETVVTETWVGCCEPYGFYDPYDPFVDMVAFGLLCAVLW